MKSSGFACMLVLNPRSRSGRRVEPVEPLAGALVCGRAVQRRTAAMGFVQEYHPWAGEVAMTETEAEGSADFAGRMIHMMNDAALALMVSVGHRTGLFDVMAAMPAATSAEIASGAALDERYVRVCVAAMTTGRIVGHGGEAG